jgi:hypothetical protein
LNGQVLVVGGCPFLGSGRECRGTATAELYDPSTGAWAAAGFLHTGRTFATATLLPTGQVLLAGGVDGTGLISAAAELYDPAAHAWTAAGSMISTRYAHTATLLQDGLVLVAGGGTAGSELFDSGLLDECAGQSRRSRQPRGDLRDRLKEEMWVRFEPHVRIAGVPYDFRLYALVLFGVIGGWCGVAAARAAGRMARGESEAWRLVARAWILTPALVAPILPLQPFAAPVLGMCGAGLVAAVVSGLAAKDAGVRVPLAAAAE